MKFFSLKRALAVLGVCFLQAASAFGAIVITSQPVDTAVADATKLTLQVQATGASTLIYTWKKGIPGNSVEVKKGTSNQFVIASAKTTDAASYFVTIEENGVVGFLDSNVVHVTVNVRPKITVHPVAPAIPPTEGTDSTDDVTFSVTLDPVIGVAPFTYQWQKKNGTTFNDVGGPTTKPDRNDTLTLNSVQLGTAGIYRVVVTNASGINVISKEVTLKVNSRPVVLTQPAATPTVTFGATGILKVVVGGNAPFTYQWLKNDVVIPKSNTASLTIKGTDNTAPGVAEGPGTYRVRIVNKVSPNYPTDPKADPFLVSAFTQSADSVVTVIRKPKIVTQPLKDIYNILGGPVSKQLSVVMDMTGNPGTLTYQWYKDNKIIVGATNSTLDFPAVSWNDRGSYKVIIKNQVGTVTSASAVVTVISPPIILAQSPLETYGTTKGTAKLFVTVTGTTPLKYEWRFRPAGAVDFNAKVIGTTNTLSLSNLSIASHHGDFQCTISNAPKGFTPAAPVLSSLFYVQVDDAPKITQQTTVLPYNVSVLKGTPNIPVAAGNKLHLKVVATGTHRPAPVGNFKINELKFQWLKNNVAIPGATSSEYIVDPITANETGKFVCQVSNLSGKVVSTALTIVAAGPPVVTIQPGNGSGIEESRIETVPLAANGAGTLKYEWQKQSGLDWSVVSGQLTTKLVLASAKISDAGTYRCRVYNVLGTTILGSVFSDPVMVAVSEIPAAVLGPVAGLSTREFFPRVARSLDKVRIFGQHLQYTNSVSFGPGAPGTFVVESNNSILVTVPSNAPTTDTPITVVTKGKLTTSIGGGTTATANPFRRTLTYENDLPNTTILTLTSGSVNLEGDDTVHAQTDAYGRAYYLLHVKKRSDIVISLIGSQVPAGLVEMELNAYRNVPGPVGTNKFAGPDGVTIFPGSFATLPPLSAAQHKSFLLGQDFLQFDTLADDVHVLIEAYSGFAPVSFPGYVNFGPYSLSVSAVVRPSSNSAVPASNVTLVNGGKWETSDRLASVTSVTEESGGETISFGGEASTASSQPVSLWQPDAGSNVTSGTVVSSFSMGLEVGNADGDDQFAWQVSSADGSPLMSLWINAADGSLRVVQPDGTFTTSAQHMTPGGGTHRFEISVNLDDDTWITLMDGVPLTEPVRIAADASFGDISAVWDLGQDQAASGASISFSNFRVEGLVAP